MLARPSLFLCSLSQSVPTLSSSPKSLTTIAHVGRTSPPLQIAIANNFLLHTVDASIEPRLGLDVSLSFLSLHRHQFSSYERRSIENDDIDRLLLVHSDLSSLSHQMINCFSFNLLASNLGNKFPPEQFDLLFLNFTTISIGLGLHMFIKSILVLLEIWVLLDSYQF
ncbi:uncharacterized protein LOC114279437 isoform X2 [Camellia sinensis]|uniref:uncharacterized protein LOC114279437 isoform X2 n=1 Tax=Camellia sinensis TaxID=4442 RepID=UPI001035EB29|nr:uncharacterized protein LOC114279437 isoform X2 [Camellia sinensis]